ncbi:unnamed protein product, partial [Larinioides sclopetarius]
MDDERVEYSFEWLIKDFSFCWHKKGEKLTSPVFYAVKLEGTSWRLVLYPRGERDEDSLHLFRNTEENVYINYKLSCPADLLFVRKKAITRLNQWKWPSLNFLVYSS